MLAKLLYNFNHLGLWLISLQTIVNQLITVGGGTTKLWYPDVHPANLLILVVHRIDPSPYQWDMMDHIWVSYNDLNVTSLK